MRDSQTKSARTSRDTASPVVPTGEAVQVVELAHRVDLIEPEPSTKYAGDIANGVHVRLVPASQFKIGAGRTPEAP